MTTLGERIRIVRGGLSQEAFAQKLGISKGSLGFYERDENLPNSSFLVEICKQNKILPEWLLFGKEPMMARESARRKHHAQNNTLALGKACGEADGDSLVTIPMVEAQWNTESGCFDLQDNHEHKYAFHTDFLDRKGNRAAMVLMRVSGDSMEPELKDGDIVLIDQSQTSPLPGRIFAVCVEGMVYLKVVNSTPGKLILSSYNSLYSPFTIDVHESKENHIKIIGRALWSCREA